MIQENLKYIWKEILNIDIEDENLDFFAAGGSSIQVLQMLNLIKERMGVCIEIIDFFDITTINRLTQYISERINHKAL